MSLTGHLDGARVQALLSRASGANSLKAVRMVFPDLFLLARSRIDSGQLPPCEHVTLLGSRGTGAPCALCDSPITAAEVEYGVEIASRRGSCWRFHIRCHGIWRDVCDELWPPETPAHGQLA